MFIETEPNRYELIGTVSFGDGCARAFPGVYGKVATVTTLNWIRNYIDDSNGEVCNDPPRLRHRRLFAPYRPINTYATPAYPVVSPELIG